MGGEPGVIPKGAVYPFGDRNKQQSVFELTINKNLDSDMMGTIFELAYAALRAAKITIPDGIGAWEVIFKYRLKDWISEHRDNHCYCDEFSYIVSFTAVEQQSLRSTPQTSKTSTTCLNWWRMARRDGSSPKSQAQGISNDDRTKD